MSERAKTVEGERELLVYCGGGGGGNFAGKREEKTMRAKQARPGLGRGRLLSYPCAARDTTTSESVGLFSLFLLLRVENEPRCHARALSPAAEAKNAPRGRGRFAAITMISPMQYRQAWKRDQERMTVIYALFLSVSGHTTHRGEETRQKNVQQTRLGVTKCRFVSAAALLANCLSLAR